jgi:hypothetical protein
MSLQTFKKKGVINYGSNRSGKGPGGIWLPQGPGKEMLKLSLQNPGPVGFSINGGRRSKGYIGKSSAMSKNGTPFRGKFPCWISGGIRGRYPQNIVYNSPLVKAINEGSQYEYIKPSVLSYDGMIEQKYRWIHSGQYPNYWVQPIYPSGSLEDNASQWLYIQTKAAANICVNDTNKPYVYEGHRIKCSPTGCSTSTGKYPSYNIMNSNVGYTKTLNVPQDASQYTLQVQRKCANPIGRQKPFPFAANNGSNGSINTVSITNNNGLPAPIANVTYVKPPDWYWKVEPSDIDTDVVMPIQIVENTPIRRDV